MVEEDYLEIKPGDGTVDKQVSHKSNSHKSNLHVHPEENKIQGISVFHHIDSQLKKELTVANNSIININ